VRVLLAALLAIACSAHVASAGHHCHEVSQVLGRRQCAGFGARWATRVSDGFQSGPMHSGFVIDHFTLPVHTFTAQVMGPVGPTPASATYASNRATTLYGYSWGIAWRGQHWTFALDMVVEGGSGPEMTATAGGMTVGSEATTIAILPQLTVGIHQRLGVFDVGAEVMAGIRAVDSYADLPAGYTGTDGKDPQLDASSSQAVVVPRARADVWLGRHFTLGVSYGHAIIGSGDIVVFNLNAHIGAYDGY
jgi:hypothetical protein